MNEKLNVFIVDDTLVFRKILISVLQTFKNTNLIGTAKNGKEALDGIKKYSPDLVLLDVEMPDMNGIEVLKTIYQKGKKVNTPEIVMLSALTENSAKITMEALTIGALDFIPKPHADNFQQNFILLKESINNVLNIINVQKQLKEELQLKNIKKNNRRKEVINKRLAIKDMRKTKITIDSEPLVSKKNVEIDKKQIEKKNNKKTIDKNKVKIVNNRANKQIDKFVKIYNNKKREEEKKKEIMKKKIINKIKFGIPKKIEIICIGVSTGGPKALGKLLKKLPGNFPIPILIVQHMPPVFTKSLANSLDKKSSITIKEAEDNEEIKNGICYIAPGGFHMVVKKIGSKAVIGINSDLQENSCRPSVDVLFRSVNKNFPGNSISVILTGMGSDGYKGIQELRKKGTYTLAENQKSCVVYGMPRIVVENNVADEVLSVEEIGERISKIVR